MNLHCTVTADIGAGERDYTAHFDYSPGRPGVHTLRNGDPGYPDDPAELYLTELECHNCTLDVSLLTLEQIETIENQCWTYVGLREDSLLAEAAEAYEAQRQEQWKRGQS